MRRFFTIFLLLVILCPCLFGQDAGEKLTDYVTNHRTEKVYVSHDKPYYAPGETIWCSLFLVDGSTHGFYTGTPVVYVDWIRPDGAIANSYTLQVIDGVAALDIETNSKDTTGAYVLRAYTQYQRNFAEEFLFQKEIRLLDAIGNKAPSAAKNGDDFSVKFFPEGGHWIEGIPATLAFKAQNSKGENIQVAGVLLDGTGELVGNVKALNEGMGLLRLDVKANGDYTVKFKYQDTEKTFPLPQPLEQGFLLKASSRSLEKIQVTVTSGMPADLQGCRLVGHCRGQVFLNQSLDGGREKAYTLLKEDLPSGLLHLTLFDPQNRPVGERLVFNKRPQEQVAVEIELEQSTFGKRDEVDFSLQTMLNDTMVPAVLSLSIFQRDLIEPGLNNLNIRNYLLLQADLKGRINNIEQYFADNDVRTNTLLDLLLLTHGWRKFSWQEVLSDQPPALFYPPEEHLTIAGKVKKYEGEQPVEADVQLHVLSPEYFTSLDVVTETDGIFVFSGFDFKDTTEVLIQASKHTNKSEKKRAEGILERTGSRYVDIHMVELNRLAFNDSVSFPSRIYRPEALKEYAYAVGRNQDLVSPGSAPWSIDLETVTVRSGMNRAQLREQEIERRYDEKGIFYFGGTTKFRADDPQFDGFQNRTILEKICLIVPQARLITKDGRQWITYGSLTGEPDVKIVLDGRVMTQTAVLNINPDDIAVIDLLEGLESLLYVRKGMVISLVSKNPGEIKRPNPGVTKVTHPGFYQAREFYRPVYPLSDETEDSPDFRTTLLWEPAVRIDGKAARLEFFTGDLSGNYLIWVEGVTVEGIPFVGKKSINVK
ncbi:MAG: hypothetical protein AB8H12_17940 [Lewinella sp.]